MQSNQDFRDGWMEAILCSPTTNQHPIFSPSATDSLWATSGSESDSNTSGDPTQTLCHDLDTIRPADLSLFDECPNDNSYPGGSEPYQVFDDSQCNLDPIAYSKTPSGSDTLWDTSASQSDSKTSRDTAQTSYNNSDASHAADIDLFDECPNDKGDSGASEHSQEIENNQLNLTSPQLSNDSTVPTCVDQIGSLWGPSFVQYMLPPPGPTQQGWIPPTPGVQGWVGTYMQRRTSVVESTISTSDGIISYCWTGPQGPGQGQYGGFGVGNWYFEQSSNSSRLRSETIITDSMFMTPDGNFFTTYGPPSGHSHE